MNIPFHRGRRLRQSPQLRALVRQTPPLLVEDLIMPYFVVETDDQAFRKEVPSMPGQYQLALGELEKQVEQNRVVLSDNEELLFKTEVKLKDLNFIPFDAPDREIKVKAKLRYRHKESDAILKVTGENEAILIFVEPQRAPAPGQAAVFYDGDMLIGGGTII